MEHPEAVARAHPLAHPPGGQGGRRGPIGRTVHQQQRDAMAPREAATRPRHGQGVLAMGHAGRESRGRLDPHPLPQRLEVGQGNVCDEPEDGREQSAVRTEVEALADRHDDGGDRHDEE